VPEFKVIKTKNTEQFVLPFTSSNSDRRHPLVYVYDKPKVTNWILTIQNNLSYASRPDAKTIVKLQEPAPSEKFIEIAMFGDVSRKFWAAVNTHDAGYVRIYERNTDGWARDQPIIIAHVNNQGLSINNGDPESPINTYAGNIAFDVAYGDPSKSPIYYLPLGMLVGVGGVVVALLVFKKRKTSAGRYT
jgi:hypothetical protein